MTRPAPRSTSPASRRAAARRRTVRAVGWLIALAVVAGLAIAGVVALLRGLEAAPPLVEACTADGVPLDADQAANAALIVGTTLQRGLPARAGTIGLATAMQESRLRNIDYGDRDSVGLFQQRPSQGWGTVEQIMDPVYSTGIFYDHLVRVPGYTELPITEAAQAVQRSGFPDAYAQHETMARAFASELTGWTQRSLTCQLHERDGDAALVPAAVIARIERDLGIVGREQPNPTVEGGTEIMLDAADLPGGDTELDRLAWAVAATAVASASETGAGRVAVGSVVWERDGRGSAWRDLEPGEMAPMRGHILVSP